MGNAMRTRRTAFIYFELVLLSAGASAAIHGVAGWGWWVPPPSTASARAKGGTVLRYEQGNAPSTMPTSAAGDYALYGLTDTKPRATVHLEAGAQLGFARNEKGEMIAVAGEKTFGPFPDTKALLWKPLK